MQIKNFKKVHIFLLIIFTSCISVFLYKYLSKDQEIIVSPLPNFLTAFANDQVSTLSLWFPILETFNLNSDEIKIPSIGAKSALIYDLTTQKTLFSKNHDMKVPMASLTKIMTAIIALESGKKDDEYIVSKENLVGENSMGLTEGEVLTLEELLYGLMLLSGNDSAEVLAGNFPEGRSQFIAAMNNKAKALGLETTNFTNPTGLEGDGDQFTTAYDLLVITKYALQFPFLKKL